jgi:hypothetical protein
MLILECSQGCYGRKDGRTDGSITLSLPNFVGSLSHKKYNHDKVEKLCEVFTTLTIMWHKNKQAVKLNTPNNPN